MFQVIADSNFEKNLSSGENEQFLISFIGDITAMYITQALLARNYNPFHWIGGVMVSKLASSAVDRGFETRSGETKNYKIGTCCFSAIHAVLRSKWKVKKKGVGVIPCHEGLWYFSENGCLNKKLHCILLGHVNILRRWTWSRSQWCNWLHWIVKYIEKDR